MSWLLMSVSSSLAMIGSREGSVFFLEELDDFRQLEGVRVVVLIDGLVEEAVQDWCQERC